MKITKNIILTANEGTNNIEKMTDKYYAIFNKVPNLILVSDTFELDKVNKFFKGKGFRKINHCYYSGFDDIAYMDNTTFLHTKKELYIVINEEIMYLMYSKTDPAPWMREFGKFKYRMQKVLDNQLCIIVPEQGSYRMSYHTLKRTEFIPNNYNTDFLPIHETIKENLNKDKSGLYLLYGAPGTGKSSYIASLTQMKTNKKFIYLPSSLFSQLDSPVLMQLFLNNRNSIFIIEDGEKLLVNREEDNYSPISALLNMSDGLIGQLLNSQIICTFNTSLDKIDEALTRNGRLICMYEFKALEKERAIELAKMINMPFEHIKENTTLANVYNQTDNKKEIKSSRKAIGFNKK